MTKKQEKELKIDLIGIRNGGMITPILFRIKHLIEKEVEKRAEEIECKWEKGDRILADQVRKDLITKITELDKPLTKELQNALTSTGRAYEGGKHMAFFKIINLIKKL